MSTAINLNNVPKERWLYNDRGMAKWMGWLLSDHSAYLNEATKSDLPEAPLTEMTAEDIDSALQRAWLNSKAVSIQLAPLYDSKFLPLIEGAVIGCTEGQVNLLQKDTTIRTIDVADIRPLMCWLLKNGGTKTQNKRGRPTLKSDALRNVNANCMQAK